MKRTAWILGSCILAATVVGRAELILNGSFESPVHAVEGVYRAVPDSWDVAGSFGIIRGQPFPDLFPAPHHGDQFLDIGWMPEYPIEVSQTVAVPLEGLYELSWAHSSAPSTWGITHRVAVLDNFGVAVVSEIIPTAKGSWGLSSLEIPLSAGDYTVLFASALGGPYDSLIDSVSLTVIPEPQTYALAAGVGLVGFVMWRKRRGC